MSISQVVRVLKSNTSRDLKKRFPFLKDVYWGTDGVWSDGYFVSTFGYWVNHRINHLKGWSNNNRSADFNQIK